MDPQSPVVASYQTEDTSISDNPYPFNNPLYIYPAYSPDATVYAARVSNDVIIEDNRNEVAFEDYQNAAGDYVVEPAGGDQFGIWDEIEGEEDNIEWEFEEEISLDNEAFIQDQDDYSLFIPLLTDFSDSGDYSTEMQDTLYNNVQFEDMNFAFASNSSASASNCFSDTWVGSVAYLDNNVDALVQEDQDRPSSLPNLSSEDDCNKKDKFLSKSKEKSAQEQPIPEQPEKPSDLCLKLEIKPSDVITPSANDNIAQGPRVSAQPIRNRSTSCNDLILQSAEQMVVDVDEVTPPTAQPGAGRRATNQRSGINRRRSSSEENVRGTVDQGSIQRFNNIENFIMASGDSIRRTGGFVQLMDGIPGTAANDTGDANSILAVFLANPVMWP